MRTTPPNFIQSINGKKYNSEFVSCDICGWGDTISISGIIVGNKVMDFCKRHKEHEIEEFIENNSKPEVNVTPIEELVKAAKIKIQKEKL